MKSEQSLFTVFLRAETLMRLCTILAFPDGEGAYISSKQNHRFFHFTSQAAPNGGKCPEGKRGAVSKKAGQIGLIASSEASCMVYSRTKWGLRGGNLALQGRCQRSRRMSCSSYSRRLVLRFWFFPQLCWSYGFHLYCSCCGCMVLIFLKALALV